jgi:hypothetical protein
MCLKQHYWPREARNLPLNYSKINILKKQQTYLISFLVEESQGGEVDEEPVGPPVRLHHGVDGGLQGPLTLLPLLQQGAEFSQPHLVPLTVRIPTHRINQIQI